jgi:hypothetical protein
LKQAALRQRWMSIMQVTGEFDLKMRGFENLKMESRYTITHRATP